MKKLSGKLTEWRKKLLRKVPLVDDEIEVPISTWWLQVILCELREMIEEVAQLEAVKERYQRLLYWALMQKDGQDVPWNGEFRFNHEQGLAWFLNQAELEALGGEQVAKEQP